MKNESNETFIIRLACVEDFDSIYKIWIEGIENSFYLNKISIEESRERLFRNFNTRSGILNFWVATDRNNKVLGWQSLTKCFLHPIKEDFYAESSTYISSKNRFEGLGEKLLSFVMSEAEKSSLEYVIGFVATSNLAARLITKKTGWIEVGAMPQTKKGKQNIEKIFMVRPL